MGRRKPEPGGSHRLGLWILLVHQRWASVTTPLAVPGFPRAYSCSCTSITRHLVNRYSSKSCSPAGAPQPASSHHLLIPLHLCGQLLLAIISFKEPYGFTSTYSFFQQFTEPLATQTPLPWVFPARKNCCLEAPEQSQLLGYSSSNNITWKGF